MEHLCDVLDKQVRSMEALPRNKLSTFNILVPDPSAHFQRLEESMPRRVRAVLAAKGDQRNIRQVLSNVMCNRNLSRAEHVAITLLIVAVCTAVSLAYDCLGVVLELNGALSATPLIFIIPSACYLKLSSGRWFRSENLIPVILIGLGLFVMITGLTMTGLSQQECLHGEEMFYCADANVSNTLPPA